MVAQPVSLTRRRRDPLDLARLNRAGARAWYEAPAYAVLAAIEKVLAAGGDAPRTPDLGGKASTADVGRAIEQAL